MSEVLQAGLKQSPLAEAQRELGAKFGTIYGWHMALAYGDPLEEQRRVRSAAGLFDFSYYGAIRVSGKEGAQFLHGLVTNDVKGLAKGKGMRAAFLTGHGKVKALARILGLGDQYLVITDPQTHEKVYKYVFPFSYAGDFKAEDVSDQFRILSVQGPAATLVMKEVCFEPVPSLEEHEWIETIIAGHNVMVARASHTGESGFDILIPSDALRDVWDFILLKGEFHDLAPIGLDALEPLRIEAGLPVYGKDVDESNMMLETGMVDAVSYTKGCYTGQEAVAMATYRGHVSKKLAGLAIAGESVPAPGEKLFKDDKEVGSLTSAIYSETLGSVIALALVKYGYFNPATTLEIRTPEGPISASIVDLPFYRRT